MSIYDVSFCFSSVEELIGINTIVLTFQLEPVWHKLIFHIQENHLTQEDHLNTLIHNDLHKSTHEFVSIIDSDYLTIV